MPWFWTDDLARLLTGRGYPSSQTIERWLRLPEGVRGEGEAEAVAERLLAEEEGEPHLAA